MITSIILFILVLAVLIASHEFGHFIVAKLSGMRVDEFALGFPPKIISWQKGETKYSINLIPFGGFVKIYGEDPTEEIKQSADFKRSFGARPKWHQALVLLAGVACNFILAWFLFSIGFMSGLPVSTGFFSRGEGLPNAQLVITGVLPGSPAEEAKLPAGSQIIEVTEKGGAKLIAPTVDQLQSFIAERSGKILEVSYLTQPNFKSIDQSAIQKTDIVPKDGVVAGKAAIGVSMDMVAVIKEPFYKAPITGLVFTANMTKYTAQALWGFGKQLFNGGQKEALAQVTGPIGLVGLVGEAGKMGFIYLLTFTALISINLAVINILPFPALDGGRLLFLAIEAITRRPLKPIVANTANLIGFVLLMLLMIAVTVKDVVSLW